MKSAEQLQKALQIKETELTVAQEKLADLQVWINANDALQKNNDAGYKNLCLFLEEKNGYKTRVIQLETQIAFLKWILE